VMTVLIPRNTPIPVRKCEIFTTAHDNQTEVEIHVLQGERPLAKDNKSLAKFYLTGIPPAPRGVPKIEVCFDVDADGILHVTAKDLGTGKQQSVRVEISSGLTPEEIERIIREAEEHAEEDRKKKELIEAKNQLDQLVYGIERTLREAGDKIPANLKEEAQRLVEEAKRVIQTATDIQEVRQMTDRVMNLSQRIGTAIYGEVGKGTPRDNEGGEGEVEAKPVD